MITVLALIFLAVSLTGWLRLWQAVSEWNLLFELEMRPGPFYLAGGGAIWGLIGLPAVYGLWTGKSWAPLYARLAVVVYLLSYWLDRSMMVIYGEPPSNWVFTLLVSVFVTGFTFWVFNQNGSKRFFQK